MGFDVVEGICLGVWGEWSAYGLMGRMEDFKG
jgi:hypothetical protein